MKTFLGIPLTKNDVEREGPLKIELTFTKDFIIKNPQVALGKALSHGRNHPEDYFYSYLLEENDEVKIVSVLEEGILDK